jgi:predicted Zn-dependent protease
MRPSPAIRFLAACTSLTVTLLAAPSALPQFKPCSSTEDLNAIGHRNIGQGINSYSLDKEKELGKVLAKEVERSSRMIDDPVLTKYVNRLAQNLAKFGRKVTHHGSSD